MNVPSNCVVTEAEAAKMLSLSPPTLRRMRGEGTAPRYVQLGARRLGYRVADLDAWIERRLSGGQPRVV